MPKLTILTTTYNRAELLARCFESLLKQTIFDFEWLIINDGSEDNTRQVVQSFIDRSNAFDIIYKEKENGGKHTAINYSHDFIRGEITLILDDDDFLLPNAVERICHYWDIYKINPIIGCLSLLKGYDKETPTVKWAEKDIVVSNAIEYRANKKRYGDCAEVVRTSVFKKYVFPIFDGEKFVSEDYLWMNMAKDYSTVYISEIIYICKYLDGGLTNAGRRMRLRNPKGGMHTASIFMDGRFSLYARIKHYMLYDIYSIADGDIVHNLKKSPKTLACTIFMPAGLLLYLFWTKRSLPCAG